MKKLFKLFTGLSIFALPALALAQGTYAGVNNNFTGFEVTGTDASDILGTISSIFGVLIPILVTFAVIYVIIGVIRYATASDEETQTTARKSIISGIIALFVIVSIWGLVAVINSTFGINQSGTGVGACQPVWDATASGGGAFISPPGC